MRISRETLELPVGAGSEHPEERGERTLLSDAVPGIEGITRGTSEPNRYRPLSSSTGKGIGTMKTGTVLEWAHDPTRRQVTRIRRQSGNPTWKRALDITCIIALFPLWLPVMVLVSLWIKLASPGPVIYRQERIGFRGRRFMILKFRSMKMNVDTGSHERHLAGLMQKNCPMTKLDASGDSRLIPGGKWLRAMGVDELPQLINVLRGEMSLVGPRPCTTFEFERYTVPQRKRANALPGLTGLWQVNGKNRTSFRRMIALDVLYTRRASFWFDLGIMAKTLPVLVLQAMEARGAKRRAVNKVNNKALDVISTQTAQNL